MNTNIVSDPAATCQQTLANVPALVAHARQHILATLDELAADVADGGIQAEDLAGLFQALHALRAIDVELESAVQS